MICHKDFWTRIIFDSEVCERHLCHLCTETRSQNLRAAHCWLGGLLAVSKSFLLSPPLAKTTSAFLEGVTSSSVSHDKNKSLTASIKKKKVFFFYELGLGTFVGMSLKSQLRVWVDPSLIEKPGMCVWVCGFYCYSISSAAAAAVTCLWLTAVSHILEKKKKKKGVPHLNYSKINLKKTPSSCVMQRHILLSNFLSLTLTQFISWRPCERPKWKTLLLLLLLLSNV